LPGIFFSRGKRSPAKLERLSVGIYKSEFYKLVSW
jgi:hypothetical protein